MKNRVILLLTALVATSVTLFISYKIDNTKVSTEADYQSPLNVLDSSVTVAPDQANLKNLQEHKKVHNLKLDGSRTVLIEGEIAETAYQYAEQIKKLSSENKKPIFVLINSPGGSVIDGALVISAIEASPAPVYTVCMQLCASMAAMIHQYGKERLVADRAILMFHDAAGGLSGYFPHMVSRINVLSRYINKMTYYVSTRTGMSFKDLVAKMHEELWLDAEDAYQARFADKIVNVLVEYKNGEAVLGNLAPPAKPNADRHKNKINIKW